jgi:hypothetical protein
MKQLLLIILFILPCSVTGIDIYNGLQSVNTVYNQYTMAANSGALAAANDVLKQVSYDTDGNGSIQYVIDQTAGTTDGLGAFASNMDQLNLGSNLSVEDTTLTYPDTGEAVLVSHATYRPVGMLGGIIAFFHGSVDDSIPMTVRGVAQIHPSVTGGNLS